MLVLAKKPEEDFKAPLNTKKQAPVTATSTKRRTKTEWSVINGPLADGRRQASRH